MNGYVRALTCVALFGVSLSTLNRAYPEWVSQAGLDVWKLPELLQEEQAAIRCRAEIEDRKAETVAYYVGRARLMERVADGSMSLFEGASAYREMNRAIGRETLVLVHEQSPQGSEEEWFCREVIFWVSNQLRERVDRQRAAAVVARLEAVLKEQLRAGTPIVLPAAKRS